MVYSIDALFGLPRKKSAGTSHRAPLHADLFFQNQSEVDEFVAKCTSADTSKPRVGCCVCVCEEF